MRRMKLGSTDLDIPVMAIGLMHLNKLNLYQAEEYISTCLEMGLNFFENADIYGMDGGPFGYCEEFFAKAAHMTPSVREKMILQTKCGFTEIQPGQGKPETIDLSKDYILKEANDSLKRLKTDYIDVYMLHAPDALADPAEIAEALDELYVSGKIRYIGVSNFNTTQLMLLQKYVKQPIVTNQLMMSVVNSGLISRGMYVNMDDMCAIDRDGGVLDYCRLNDITVQCWSVMQAGYMGGCFLGHPDYKPLNAKIEEVAERYGVPAPAIAIAWLLRHPAHLLPISGTMNVKHLAENAQGADIMLTRKEWYEIWKAAGNFIR